MPDDIAVNHQRALIQFETRSLRPRRAIPGSTYASVSPYSLAMRVPRAVQTAAKGFVSYALNGIVGGLAFKYAVEADSIPEGVRATVLVIIWPVALICGTVLWIAWLWRDRTPPTIEPLPPVAPHEPDPANARKALALDRLIDRNYKDDPTHNLSPEGLKHEPAWDVYRRSIYDKLGIGELFVPDPRQARTALAGLATEATELANELLRTGKNRSEASVAEAVRQFDRKSVEHLSVYAIDRVPEYQLPTRLSAVYYDGQPMWLSNDVKHLHAQAERLGRYRSELPPS